MELLQLDPAKLASSFTIADAPPLAFKRYLISLVLMSRAKVFISYAREDLAFAERLYDALSGEFSPWMDKKNLVGGQDWERALTLAVRRSDFFIFCASNNSANKRGTIQKEIKLALEVWRGKLEDDIYFIPLRLEACEVPDQISRFQWIDAFENGWFEKIVRALQHGITQAKSAPSPLPISFEERVIEAVTKLY